MVACRGLPAGTGHVTRAASTGNGQLAESERGPEATGREGGLSLLRKMATGAPRDTARWARMRPLVQLNRLQLQAEAHAWLLSCQTMPCQYAYGWPV
eukprot:5921809-Prymnesium_polylepis.1